MALIGYARSRPRNRSSIVSYTNSGESAGCPQVRLGSARDLDGEGGEVTNCCAAARRFHSEPIQAIVSAGSGRASSWERSSPNAEPGGPTNRHASRDIVRLGFRPAVFSPHLVCPSYPGAGRATATEGAGSRTEQHWPQPLARFPVHVASTERCHGLAS